MVITPDDGNDGDIDGGELPEVDVYPGSDQEINPGSDNNGDGDPEEPEPIEPTEDSAEDQDTSGDDGNTGNNSNNDNYQTPVNLSPALQKITNYTSMNQTQVDKLETALQECLNRTIGSKIYDILVSKNVTLDFRIDSKAPNNAYFAKESNNIFFKSEDAINGFNLREELIHAAQYAIYENRMSDDYTNFEFEAKILVDIDINLNDFAITYIGTMGMLDNEDYCVAYENFIEGLSSGSIENDQLLNETFDELGETWTSEGESYDGTFNSEISPDLLIELF